MQPGSASLSNHLWQLAYSCSILWKKHKHSLFSI
ncbi:rCG41099 [Rattus norvegicus]|uniref:RCG41099 n=1 Tax=Rattus norvegicus TaxID=10116 RepID=A6K296_RAT|nr:rCG41099 [Rattus norvegicus]